MLVIVIAGLTLLFPRLLDSRENARAGHCQTNIRNLHLAMQDYLLHKPRLPAENSWPTELTKGDSETSYMVLVEPRPIGMTCPAHADPAPKVAPRQTAQTNHYVLVVDRKDKTFSFRDREQKPQGKIEHWTVGVELSPEQSRQQIEDGMLGPHFGTYQESHDDAKVRYVTPPDA